MTIWADVNGWPVPPTVLVGCLVAEILYFRGWCVLVKAENEESFYEVHTTTGVGCDRYYLFSDRTRWYGSCHRLRPELPGLAALQWPGLFLWNISCVS